MTKEAKSSQSRKPATKFETMLQAWRSGQDVTWAELLAAWVEAPAAPPSPDLIVKVIQSVDAR
jgi:hypothetical protein